MHFDGHAASCQANQGVCEVCCSQREAEAVNGNNEPNPACDPQLMLHTAILLPFSLSNMRVSKQERLFPDLTVEITGCLGSLVNYNIIEVRG